MEEFLFKYLIDKGGVFGLLFSVTLAWLMFKERILAITRSFSKKKDSDEGSETLFYIIGELKKTQEKADDHLNSIIALSGRIYELEEAEVNNLVKIGDQVNKLELRLLDIEKKTSDLWDWHSVKDGEGVPLWYMRRSFEDSVNKLELSVVSLQHHMQESLHQINDVLDSREELSERLERINEERIAELKNLLEKYNKTMTDLVLTFEKVKIILKARGRSDYE